MTKALVHNHIFQTGRSLIASLALAAALVCSSALSVCAADGVPHVASVDGDAYAQGTITLSWGQDWNISSTPDAGYSLTPLGAWSESGYAFNTAQEVQDGNIAWTVSGVGGQNPTSLRLAGSTTSGITFTWQEAGLYLFDLGCTSGDGNGYTYDHTTYRIRLYVRSSTETAFITVQDLGAAGDGSNPAAGKVASITYHHDYTAPDDGGSNGGGGDGSSNDGDGSDGGGGSSNTAATTAASEEVRYESDSGSAGDDPSPWEELIERITEWGGIGDENVDGDGGSGSHANQYTGDSSPMIVYGGVALLAAIVLVIWRIRRRRV